MRKRVADVKALQTVTKEAYDELKQQKQFVFYVNMFARDEPIDVGNLREHVAGSTKRESKLFSDGLVASDETERTTEEFS